MDSVAVISNLLQQAVEMIASAQNYTWPSDERHPVTEAIIQISFTILEVKKLIEKLVVKKEATRVISFLKEQKVDYTLILFLQLPDKLKKTSEMISYLTHICSDMKVEIKTTYFFEVVWKIFESEGVSPVTPDKFITAPKKNTAIEDYCKVKKSWGCHNPYFFQTYTTKDGNFTEHLYHITRTAQDGLIRLLDILKAGGFMTNGKIYNACGAFEHVLGPRTLTCQLFDCEIKSSAFGNAKTVDEIKEMVECFPRAISHLMIKHNLISIEDFITFVVKDRTRKTGESYKISNHFISYICATKEMHRQAMEICLNDEWKENIDAAAHTIKETGLLPESFYADQGVFASLLTLDYSAIKSNGITTAFSRKEHNHPFPIYTHTDEVVGAEFTERYECLKRPQDLEGSNIDDAQRLMLLYIQSYTLPHHNMTYYTDEAMETLTADASEGTVNTGLKKNGGEAQRPAPRPQRASNSGSSSPLPAWLVSALEECAGKSISDVRTDLPFLYKLKDTLPDAARDATLCHIPHVVCARRMTLGEIYNHGHNGTVFAVHPASGLVYTTCSTGDHKITENKCECLKVVNMYSRTNEDGKPQPVESVKGKCVHWVMLDEESMRLFMQTAKKTMDPPNKKIKV